MTKAMKLKPYLKEAVYADPFSTKYSIGNMAKYRDIPSFAAMQLKLRPRIANLCEQGIDYKKFFLAAGLDFFSTAFEERSPRLQ
jgi:hypothetical protein